MVFNIDKYEKINNKFIFQIEPTFFNDCLMITCEPPEYSLFSEPILSITFSGKASDIKRLIENIKCEELV